MFPLELLSGDNPPWIAAFANACDAVGPVNRINKRMTNNFAVVKVKPASMNNPKMINPTPAVSVTPAAWTLEKKSGNRNMPMAPITTARAPMIRKISRKMYITCSITLFRPPAVPPRVQGPRIRNTSIPQS